MADRRDAVPREVRPDPLEPAEAFGEQLAYVYRTFRRLGAGPAEAEDLAQDVFVVVWQRWSDYQPDRPLRPWLAGIANLVARGHFRRRNRLQLSAEPPEPEDRAPSPEDQLVSARARLLASKALAALPERQRAILIRHEIDGLSIREIAEEMSVPFFTAATRIRRARMRFAGEVKRMQRVGRGHLVVVPLPLSIRRPRWPLLLPLAVTLAGLFVIITGWPRGAASNGTPAAATMIAAAVERPPDPTRLPPPHLLPPHAGAPGDGTAPAEAPGPRTGLVAAWHFEDGPGSLTAADASGRGHPCLLHELDPATAWVRGRVGGAVDLGRTGWLECPLPESATGAPVPLSVAAWIKLTGELRPRDTVLFTRQLPRGDSQHLFWFGIRAGRLTLWSWAWQGWTSSPAPALDGWRHVAFVHSGRDTVLYVDGVRTAQRDNRPQRGQGVVHSSLTIGAIRYAPDPLRVRQHFDGLVDEALVFDRALSDAEVAALARAPVVD
jgi:RNA polymerase sigma factor (sigma-70 family)